MTVYRLQYDSNSFPRNYISTQETDTKLPDGRAGMIVGRPRLANWKVLEGTYSWPDSMESVACPDLSKLNSEIVFSEKAREILGEKLESYGEFLPISIEGDRRYIFNILNSTNAIDPFSSKKEEFEGMVIGIEKIAFLEHEIKDFLIFRTPYDDYALMYCTDAFIALVETSELTSGWLYQTALR